MLQDKQKEPWWKPAFEIFGQVSAWVAVPIVIALVTGKWLDGRYGTKPWLFLGFSAAAFLISSFGIVRTVTVYMNQINPSTSSGQTEKENDDSNKTVQ
ncbi:MAG: AtpZ/AtpI family protein [bacterium]|nr:AtpZ/AtpI family protein [bacterium]